jgi:hypothetical protein
VLVVSLLGALSGGRADGRPLTSAEIDRIVSGAWRQARIKPAPVVDDARFLRRVYQDLTGVLPTHDAVSGFLADRSRGKRAELVAALLASGRYAEHFARYWETILLGRKLRRPEVDRAELRRWLRPRLDANLGWDRVAFELVTASGANRSLRSVPATPAAPVVGAVNWHLRYDRNPQDLAGAVSRLFLGVQIQCAQCHDHPSGRWKQEDFIRFAASFARTHVERLDAERVGRAMGGPRVELLDLAEPLGRGKLGSDRREILAAKPRALDGTELLPSENPRRGIARWMTSPQNPWFARAFVNRMWSLLIGRGLVEPVDDLREGNPATIPALLDRLAEGFVESGHDVKRLVATICGTRVYQLAAGGGRHGDREDELFARRRLRPLSPDELFDAIVSAADLDRAFAGPGNLERARERLRRELTFAFDLDEEFEPRESQGTIPQALLLMNGQLANMAARANPGSALGSEAARIAHLYLRVLSRPPTAAERTFWIDYVNAPRDVVRGRAPRAARGRLPIAQTARDQAYEDLLWALLNSGEFAFH